MLERSLMHLLDSGLIFLCLVAIPAVLIGAHVLGAVRRGEPSLPRRTRRMHNTLKTQLKGLERRLAHWPLSPPSFWCRRPVWVAWTVAVWGIDLLTTPVVQASILGMGPVLLAAWCGRLAWGLGLALVASWGTLMGWWWWDPPWPLWIELLNAAQRSAGMGVAAVLMTALQRHAVRLALERNPRLPPEQGDGNTRGSRGHEKG